ncbi:hypothetical protein [Lysinibacillus fusiformis]|uniref:hypothetical protein n=1 Tax=Lysinibacillus fusiformis TaxID=28031 RepID=UPI001EF4EADD|nr:hypothetical protein [Lysinibacillus fusiformis]MCG7435548.1 hypothetical protein [Lysinibacillus fusiformis]
MADFFKVLITDSPLLVQIIIFAIVIIGIALMFVFLSLGAYRFATAVNKESKAFDLSKSNQDLVRENEKLKDELQKFTNLVESTSNVMEVSNKKLEFLHNSAFDKMIDSWINKDLTILVKTKTYFLENMTDIIYSALNLAAHEVNYQNRGRLSLWSLGNDNEDDSDENHYLQKVYRSVQFNYSKNETNKLDINESIAGRAYRTKSKQIVLDLVNDPDWNKASNDTYKSIIAYPIGKSRVLTIDFKEFPNQKEQDFINQIALHLDYLYHFRDGILDYMIYIEALLEENDNEEYDEYNLEDIELDDEDIELDDEDIESDEEE